MDNNESTTTQQEISSETTPAQATSATTTETTQSTQETKQTEQPATANPENWEYEGDRKAVPKEFEKYVKGLDRYVSKKDQAAAEARKKAEEYDKLVSSETYKQFVSNQPTNTGSMEMSKDQVVSQEEADAIALGDTNTLMKVIQREVQRKIDATVSPKEAEINKRFQAMDMKEKQIESAEMIQAFAGVHKDFWELYEDFEDYMVHSLKAGKSLEETYGAATQMKEKIAAKLELQRKADFEKKKAGSVVGKSIPGTPDVVFADNEDHAKKLAIELTLKGDKRHVRIKPKK